MSDPVLPLVLVRGSGDVGSAVAHRLFLGGFPVVVHDEPAPAAPRRGMAFTDAVFEGTCSLEQVRARRIDHLDELEDALAGHDSILVFTSALEDLIVHAVPHVLVDARMRKHAQPGIQIGLAELTIGLGPNFVAGRHTHLVVETKWGDALGTVLREGSTMPLDGEPRSFKGHSRDRFIYAPTHGLFRTDFRIADPVVVGEVVAKLDGEPLHAPLSGILRGLVHDGVTVKPGAKIVEVDPRSDPSTVFGIGERPGRIAGAVFDAIHEWHSEGH